MRYFKLTFFLGLWTFVLFILFPHSQSVTLSTPEVKYINAKLGDLYSVFVDSNTSYVYSYHVTEFANTTVPVRLSMATKTSATDLPILISVKQEASVAAFTLPIVIENLYSYEATERTLCPSKDYPGPPLHPDVYSISIDVSTAQQAPTSFSLQADHVQDFFLEKDSARTVTVSPATPKYFFFEFPADVDQVVIQVTSDEASPCAIVSVQEPKCPVYDIDRYVEYAGRYQTMSTQAALTIAREQDKGKFSRGFHLVLIVQPTDIDCTRIETIAPAGSPKSAERQKQMKIVIKDVPSKVSYYAGIGGTLGVFALFYVIAITICCSCDKSMKQGRTVRVRANYEDISSDDPSTSARRVLNQNSRSVNRYGAVSSDNPGNDTDWLVGAEAAEGRRRQAAGLERSVSVPSDVDFCSDAENDEDIVRIKPELFLSDLSKRGDIYHGKKAGFFTRTLLVVAVFYGLPVIQLVLGYLQVLNKTGDLDLCYYNLLCSRPLFMFTNFNNIISNAGYVLLGVLFLFIVAKRHRNHIGTQKDAEGREVHCGIPQHYGLFYSMGLALIMEGILSASYHVCPSAYNFQFDTAFMYLLAVLQMLKLYQARHPDVSPSASAFYMAMAAIIFIAVIGVVYNTVYLWVVYSIAHILFSIAIAAHFYYLGLWKLNCGIFRRLCVAVRTEGCRCWRPRHPTRLMLLLIALILNWTAAIYGAYTKPSDFATFILGVMLVNLILYLMFYIIMKLRYREGLPVVTTVFSVLAMACWAASLYFFTAGLTDWKLSPAESRAHNQECIVINFYDSHDVWHFLSSIAIFFSFMVLLTMDDGIMHKSRREIHVF